MPCRSSRSSASARRSGVAGEEPLGERPAALRRRVAGRPRRARSGAGAARASGRRSGGRRGAAARRRSSPRRPRRDPRAPAAPPRPRAPSAASRSNQNSALVASAARIASCASPSGVGAPAGRPSTGGVLAEEERDAVEPGADPDDLAGRAELVELLRPVARDAARQHLGLPERDRQRERLQRDERLAQRRAAVDPVPARQEAAERRLLDRLDLACAAPRATRAAAGAARRGRTTRARCRRAGARRGRACSSRSSARSSGSTSRPKRSFASRGRERPARAGEARDERAQRLVARPRGTRPAGRTAASRRARRGSGPRPRPRSAAPRRRCERDRTPLVCEQRLQEPCRIRSIRKSPRRRSRSCNSSGVRGSPRN